MDEEHEGSNQRARNNIDKGAHGQKVHVWAGIFARGSTRIILFQGNLNADGYLELLKQGIDDMRRLYPEDFTFSYVVMDYLDENVIQVLDWPAYSPDVVVNQKRLGLVEKRGGKRSPIGDSSFETFKRLCSFCRAYAVQ